MEIHAVFSIFTFVFLKTSVENCVCAILTKCFSMMKSKGTKEEEDKCKKNWENAGEYTKIIKLGGRKRFIRVKSVPETIPDFREEKKGMQMRCIKNVNRMNKMKENERKQEISRDMKR